jgi:hypothetical protein
MAVTFSIEATPNPNALKFSASQVILEGRLAQDSSVAKALLEIDGVESVFGFQDFISVNKTVTSNWDDIVPQVQAVFEQEF